MMNFHKVVKNHIASVHIIISLFLFLIMAGTLFSCGIGIRTRSLLGGKLHFTVNISEKANRNSPIALDLVFIYDEKLLEKLLEMPAKEWFEKREQIKRDNPEGISLDCWSWEWVPGQNIPVQELPLKAAAEGSLIFADYLTPGAHRNRVDPFKDITVRLLEEDFYVEN
ncbi:hypothetical protein [Desulfonema magnum]|nr:hypothetical protein [Desulfonema magnum]